MSLQNVILDKFFMKNFFNTKILVRKFVLIRPKLLLKCVIGTIRFGITNGTRTKVDIIKVIITITKVLRTKIVITNVYRAKVIIRNITRKLV